MRRVLGVLALATLAGAGLAAGIAASGGASTHASSAVTRVTVVASEWKFVLSKRSVPVGTVLFTVKNKGKIAHDFKIAGKKTPLIQPGKAARVKVVFKKKGRFAYLCTVTGHARLGMKGVLAVGRKPVTSTTTTQTTTQTTTNTTTQTTTTVSGPATTVTVGLYEYRFQFSQQSVPSGTVTFVITNRGTEPHNFDIAGVKAGAILAPGESETWSVGLAPKAYTVVCDVPFHVDRGMIDQFIVT